MSEKRISYTPEQEQAVNRSGNLLVSAAAGSGKTFVLTERVIRLVKEGIGLDRMLILTFTRAAAAEMKERIAKALTETVSTETDEKKKAYLKHQLLLCPSAAISTIDSFCGSVVRRFYYLENLAPGLQVISDSQEAILLSDAADAALTRAAVERRSDYQELLLAFRRDSAIKEALLRLYNFLSACPDRDGWIKSVTESSASGSMAGFLKERFFPSYKEEMRSLADTLQAAYDRLPASADDTKSYVSPILNGAKGALTFDDPASYLERLGQIDYPPQFRRRKDVTKEEADSVNVPCKAIKETASFHGQLFSASPENEADDRHVSRLIAFLMELYKDMADLFTEAKLDSSLADFADMEYYCLKILRHEEAAKEYRERFSVIIVDEYQDSNSLQEEILNCIRRKDGLFLVGDVKQSIYGFRNAEPEMFLRKTEGWDEGTCLNLTCNFRSSKEVLDAVNDVFFHIMTKETGSLAYTDEVALHAGGNPPAGTAELHIISDDSAAVSEEETADGEEDSADASLDGAETEALFCAETIRRIKAEEMYTDRSGNTRPYENGDFTILLRSNTPAAKFASILSASGLPCYSKSAGRFFEAVEVRLFLNLLRVIDNRRQDIPLVSVLRSLTGGFTDDDLIELRSASKGTLLDCLLKGGEKTGAFLEKIAAWREMSLYMPMRELCSRILDETGFETELCSLPGGAQRVGNLNALLVKAGEYDDSGLFGLGGFLAFTDKLSEAGKDREPASCAGTDAVHIMTVHGSKGLEFPVVFYCNLGSKFETRDASGTMLLSNSCGVALKYANKENVIHAPQLYNIVSDRIKRSLKEEEMRVLYVGMTRAVRKLYLVGTVKPKKDESAEQKVQDMRASTPADIRGAGNPLIWVVSSWPERAPLAIHIKSAFEKPSAREATALPGSDSAALAAFTARLYKPYPHPLVADVPEKTSATDLENRLRLRTGSAPFEKSGFTLDPFTEGEETFALRHGTSMHAVLKSLPLGKDKEKEREARLALLGEKDGADMRWFLSTDLFKRMQSSPLCRRELTFTTSRKSGDLPGLNPGGEVLLQGAIDCCFTEDGGYVLLDYKTDRFRGRTAEETAETHRMQAELYADALASLTKKPVKETYIVFLGEHTYVKLD